VEDLGFGAASLTLRSRGLNTREGSLLFRNASILFGRGDYCAYGLVGELMSAIEKDTRKVEILLPNNIMEVLCVCVYMYGCKYVCVGVYVCTYIFICMSMYIYTRLLGELMSAIEKDTRKVEILLPNNTMEVLCMCVYVWMYICMCGCACIYIYCVCVYMYVCIHVCVCVYV